MRYWPTLLLVVAVLAAPFIWHLSAPLFDDGSDARQAEEIAALRAEIARLGGEVQGLTARVDGLDARTARALTAPSDDVAFAAPGLPQTDSLSESFAQVVLIGDRRDFNDGMTLATPTFLMELLGLPREDLTDDCQDPTNPTLVELVSLEDVGPIKAKLIQPALISLRQIFANVQVFEPELYRRIHSAGSFCVRQIRGAVGRASSHAYGLAVDINIDGVLDTLGDGKTQLGLVILSEFFKKEGWIWGAAFSREDSMHFEVSREKLEQWRRLGQI